MLLMPNKMRRCGVHVVRSDLFTTALQYTQYIYIIYIYIIYICICDCFDCHRQEDDQADLDACLEAGFSFGTAGFAKLWICPACAQHHSIAS